FFICFLPYHALEVWYYLSPTAESDYNDFTHALRIIAFCLSFLNSCVNPVALYCVSGVFRQHFNRYLCCRRGALHPTCSSRLSRTAICETSFRSTQRHRCNRYALIYLYTSTRFINSCVNPIALCSMSDVYKKYFIRYVCCKKDVLHARNSSRLRRLTRDTALGNSQRHTFKRNPTESIVISNYDYGSTKKKNNIISRNSNDGVTIMTVRDPSDFMNDVNEKCIER
ncbi:jg2616, partial [Pararge aegeria aegeria]